MPTYEFRCPNGHSFDEFHKISDAPSTAVCPVCGAVAERAITGGAGLVFKGSGFYLTDYGKNAHRGGSAPSKGGESSGGGDSKGGESKSSDAKSSEAKPAASGGGTAGSSSASSGGTSGGSASSGGTGGSTGGGKAA